MGKMTKLEFLSNLLFVDKKENWDKMKTEDICPFCKIKMEGIKFALPASVDINIPCCKNCYNEWELSQNHGGI